MYVSGSTERMAEAAKPFHIRHIITGFQSCFGPVLPMSPFLPFGMVMYIFCVTTCNWKYIICFLKMKNNLKMDVRKFYPRKKLADHKYS